MSDLTRDATENSYSLSWWVVAGPDTITLGEARELWAEADRERKQQRRKRRV